MLKEFVLFLKEFNVIALAVAFIMSAASTALVNSLVKDILMPIVASFVSIESWKEATFHIGRISVAYGAFIAELFNFVILALIVFILVKKLLRMEVQTKK